MAYFASHLAERGIPFVPQRKLRIGYKGRILKQIYKANFVLLRAISFVCFVSFVVNSLRFSHYRQMSFRGAKPKAAAPVRPLKPAVPCGPWPSPSGPISFLSRPW